MKMWISRKHKIRERRIMGWKLTANGSRLAPRPILQKVGVYCPVVSEIIFLVQVIKVKFKCSVQQF